MFVLYLSYQFQQVDILTRALIVLAVDYSTFFQQACIAIFSIRLQHMFGQLPVFHDFRDAFMF